MVSMKEPKPASLVYLGFLCLNPFVSMFSGCFDFPRTGMYFRLLLKCTLRAHSIESACNEEFGSPDRLLFYIKKASVEQVKGFSCMLFKSTLKVLKGYYDVSRGVWVAIDVHSIPYYGRDSCWVFYTVKRKGSRVQKIKVLKYATVAIVARRFKFTLACIPLRREDHLEDAMDVLLRVARGLVRIKMVLMDREFYNQHVLRAVEKHGLCYLVPVKWSVELDVLYWLSQMRGKWMWSYVMKSRGEDRKTGKKTKTLYKQVTVYFHEAVHGEYQAFTTNRTMKRQTAESLMRIYDLRWNIENSYKDAENYVVKTSTRNHAYRYLLFVLSHLMLNLQELAKKAVGTHIRGNEMLMVFEILVEKEDEDRPSGRIRLTKHVKVQF